MRNYRHSFDYLHISKYSTRRTRRTVLRQELSENDVGGVRGIEPRVGHDGREHMLFLVEISIGVQADSLASDRDTLVGHPFGPGFTKRDCHQGLY